MIYLDHAASTEEMQVDTPYVYANPSSNHKLGDKAWDKLWECREKVSNFLRCKPEEIIFTSGASECNKIAMKMTKDLSQVLIDPDSHSSIISASNGKFKDLLPDIEFKPVGGFASICHPNNVHGYKHSVDFLKTLRRFVSIIHMDCSQAVGRCKIPMEIADMVTLSPEKFHGPKGVGILYIRDSVIKSFPNFNRSNRHEFGLRKGTQNVDGILKACNILSQEYSNIDYDTFGIIRELKSRMKKAGYQLFCNHTPDIQLYEIGEYRITHTGRKELQNKLSDKGLCVSQGSACGGLPRINNLASARPYKDKLVRFSLPPIKSFAPGVKDIRNAVDIVKEVCKESHNKNHPNEDEDISSFF